MYFVHMLRVFFLNGREREVVIDKQTDKRMNLTHMYSRYTILYTIQ